MANELTQSLKDQIREAFLSTGSIKAATRASGVSRNTARRLLRFEGLIATLDPSKLTKINSTPSGAPTAGSMETGPMAPMVSQSPDVEKIDFLFLNKLLEMSSQEDAKIDFTQNLKMLSHQIVQELGLTGAVDMVRVEAACLELICYRRFFVRSLTVSDQKYEGDLLRCHLKRAKIINSWVEASKKSLDNFLKIVRELEVRSGRRLPDFGRNNIFMNQPEIRVEQGL